MKKTFLEYEKPLLTVMLQCKTPEVAIGRIRKSLELGGEAFGLQTECLLPEYRNPETYKRIFAEMQDKPVYVTNYRRPKDNPPSDEEIAEGLLTLAECGATLCDVMGDMFCRHPEEMTDDPEAIKKQMQLIEELHKKAIKALQSTLSSLENGIGGTDMGATGATESDEEGVAATPDEAPAEFREMVSDYFKAIGEMK